MTKTYNRLLNLSRLVLAILPVFVYFFSASLVYATGYYASPGGSSSASCTSYATACSLNTGLGKLGTGDTLYLLGGSYNQTVSISKSNVTIAGYSGEAAIIDGGGTIPSGTWNPLVNISGSNVIFKDIEVTRSNGAGIDVLGSHSQTINVYAHHNHEAGILLIGDYTVADGCRIYYNSMHNENGKQLSAGGGWGTGISACRHPSYATIKNTKSWNNWGEGLSTFGADHTTLEDNIVYDNWSINMYIQNVQYALVQRNLVYRTPNNLFTQPGVQNSQGRERGIAENDEANDAQYGNNSNNTYINNLVMGGIGNFVHWSSSPGMSNALIANNTFVNSTGGKPNIQISGTSSNVQFRNNIIVQDDSLSISSGGSGVTKSNNLWSKSGGASGNDTIGNPQLARTGAFSPGQLTGNWFKLTADSLLAIDRAVSLAAVTKDYFKNIRLGTPDIGAHEYGGGGGSTSSPAPTKSPTPAPTKSPTPHPTTSATSSPTPTSSPGGKVGDINGDGQVNMVDIGIIIDVYGIVPVVNSKADLNHDGQVNMVDMGIVIDNYGV